MSVNRVMIKITSRYAPDQCIDMLLKMPISQLKESGATQRFIQELNDADWPKLLESLYEMKKHDLNPFYKNYHGSTPPMEEE